MKFKSIVLAAGKGTRMKSNLPKVLHKVNGVPMLHRAISVLEEAGSEENVLVLGHKKEEILETLGEVSYVEQKEQLGTGHAVKTTWEKFSNYKGIIVVVNADNPLFRSSTLLKLVERHKKSGAKATVLTAMQTDPFGYGRIVKKDGKVVAIIEEKDASDEIKAIKEINTGTFCFDSEALFEALGMVTHNNEKGEYYLTDVVSILVGEGEFVDSCKVYDLDETLGINSKWQLSQAESVMRERKNRELMEEGVIIIDPANTYVEDKVKIGRDTVLYPNVVIQGDTVIGENCEISGDSRIIDSEIGNNVTIQSSFLKEGIKVADNVKIGPFARLRGGAELSEDVVIGNFVEIKNSKLGKGVKSKHLTYLGDAEVGEKTNFGAGVVTCNYDGQNKYKSVIGKNVFVGSDTMIVSPVHLADGVYTAAGSVITHDVPSGMIAFARARQENKEQKKLKKGKSVCSDEKTSK